MRREALPYKMTYVALQLLPLLPLLMLLPVLLGSGSPAYSERGSRVHLKKVCTR